MIFVTVGTERFAFDRLVQEMDELALRLKGEPLVVQLGHSRYVPRRCRWIRFLSYSDFADQLAKARLVVSHAGVGALLLCAQLGKVPIAVPRRRRFGEHVDDHQVELARRMAALGYARLAEQPREAASLVLDHADHQGTSRRISDGDPGLASAIAEYLSAINDRQTVS